MTPRHRYFDSQGNEVSAAEATRAGVLKSGYAIRVPTQFRDAAPRQRFTDARQYWDHAKGTLVVTDAARLGGTAGNRPGFRVLDNDLGRGAKERALADAEAYLTGAWRDADARRECPTCEGSGEVDGETCERCQGTGELDDGDDDDDIDVTSDRRAQDRGLTADAWQARRDAAVSPARNALIDEIANAWRGGSK
jgi:hypothetical protein